MASARACPCRESATDATSRPLCPLSAGGAIARARDGCKRDCMPTGSLATHATEMAHGWNLSGSQKAARRGQSSFDAFAPYVLKRWEEGERTGITLWREIKDQGYTGTQRSVYRYLETLKQAEVRATASPSRLQKFSATTAVWLGCRVTLRLLMTSNERIWPPFAKSA